MKNKLTPSDKIDVSPFLQVINNRLSDNLTGQLMKNLSTLLALDYANRLKSEPHLDDYILLCTSRLQKHLGHKVITDESFAGSMTLFCLAITPEKESENDIPSLRQVQDAAVDTVIEMHFGNLSREEKDIIKFVLQDILSGKDGPEISNFLSSNPKLFHCVVIRAAGEKKKQQEIVEFVRLHINKLMVESNLVARKVSAFRNLGSKFSLAAGLAAVASAGLALGNLLLPAFMIPATAASVKYTPKIGEKIGEIVAGNIGNIKQRKESLAQVKKAVIDLSGQTNSVALILAQNQGSSLETIKEKLQQVSTQYNKVSKKSHAKAIRSILSQEQKEIKQSRSR